MQRALATFFFLALVLISFQVIQAQTTLKQDSISTLHKNVISTNLLFIIAGTVNLNYERTLTKKVSVNFAFYYELANRNEELFQHTTIFFTQTQARYYPFGKSPKGFFLGGYFLYGYESFLTRPFSDYGMTFPAQSGNVGSVSFGPVVGYKFLIIKRTAAELSLEYGPNFSWGNNILDYDIYPFSGKTTGFPSINLGYVF